MKRLFARPSQGAYSNGSAPRAAESGSGRHRTGTVAFDDSLGTGLRVDVEPVADPEAPTRQVTTPIGTAEDRRGRGVAAGARLGQVMALRRTAPAIFWVFALGLLLRLITLAAYYPALEFNGDSFSYLWNSEDLTPNLWHPLIYPIFLKGLSVSHLLVAVPVVQHALGLATGVLIYRLVRSFGVGDLGSALAAAPVLLDAFQIDVEHVVLSEALFEILLVGGLYLVLKQRRSLPVYAVAGVLLGLATLTRTVALPCALVAIVVMLLLRCGWKPIAATTAALAVPLVGYALIFHSYYGQLAWTSYSGRELYGEVAQFAKCDKLPATDQALCPSGPLGQRAGSNQYTWSPGSLMQRLPDIPLRTLPADATEAQLRAAGGARSVAINLRDDKVAGTFARDVIKNQPVDYAHYVVSVLAHYFEPGRHTGPRDFSEVSWQFPARLDPPPPWNIGVARMGFESDVIQPRMSHKLASVLRGYQRFAYTPGPLLLLGLLIGAWGALSGWRTRKGILAGAFVLCGLGTLLMPSLGAGFDYRYALPAQLFLPAALVLGVSVIRESALRRAESRPSAAARFFQACGDRRRAALAAGTAAVVLVATANAAGAQMLPGNKQRAGVVGAMGSTQTTAGGQVAVTAGQPTLMHKSCSKVGHRWRITWLVTFNVKVNLLRGQKRLVQVDDFALDGDRRDPFDRPASTKRRSVLPDAVLSAGMSRSGFVQFFLTRPDGTLFYNTEPNGGLAAWQYAFQAPARTDAPGTICVPPPPDVAAAMADAPWGAPQPLSTEPAKGD